MPDQSYNPIFEKLVIDTEEDSSDRLIGILAYGEYKLNKYEYFNDFHAKFDRALKDEEEEQFLLCFNDRRLDEMRSSAETRLYAFADTYLDEQLSSIQKDAVDNSIVRTVENIGEKALKGVKKYSGFWPSIVLSALGALLYTVVTALIILLFTVVNPDSTVAKLTRAFLTDQKIIIQTMPQEDQTAQ